MILGTLRTFGKITLASVLLIGVCACIAVVMLLSEKPSFPNDSLPAQVKAPASLTTDTWGIFDPRTGEVLAGNNITEPRPIASITKLFTAETVFLTESQDDVFPVTYSDISTEGRAGKLVYGKKVTPYALLFPLLIESSNDAAEAIRRHLGTSYTDAIHEITETLPLTHTEIYDASGLSPQNRSSVADLSLFYTYVRKHNPHVLDITQLHTYVSEDTGYVNNNPARSLATFTGGKNGYTPEAGKTFIGTFTISDSHTELGVVLLKSEDLLSDIQALLAYGESF